MSKVQSKPPSKPPLKPPLKPPPDSGAYYADYLTLDRLLAAQDPESARHGRLAHDEMLFIIRREKVGAMQGSGSSRPPEPICDVGEPSGA